MVWGVNDVKELKTDIMEGLIRIQHGESVFTRIHSGNVVLRIKRVEEDKDEDRLAKAIEELVDVLRDFRRG